MFLVPENLIQHVKNANEEIYCEFIVQYMPSRPILN